MCDVSHRVLLLLLPFSADDSMKEFTYEESYSRQNLFDTHRKFQNIF